MGKHWSLTPTQAEAIRKRMAGHVVSAETRLKISNAAKKNAANMTIEEKIKHGAKLSAILRGKRKSIQTRRRMHFYAINRTKEHNAKISTGLMGKKLSKEHIEHQRQAKYRTGFWKRIGHRYLGKGGYIWLKTAEGKGRANYEQEHRVIMAKHLGRSLESDEHVHHIDGNRSNNDISNLALLSIREHRIIANLLYRLGPEFAKILLMTIKKQFPHLDS